MKKVLSIMIMAALVACTAVPAYAGAGEKAKEGFKKFITSPKNIPDSISEEVDAQEGLAGKSLGALGGTAKGLFYMLKDMGIGLYEVVTFPINNEDY